MAKVVSPLFSFSARGAIAKSIVFFPWKGINCVRQWVKPANPNTDAQDTQRGYLEAAVIDIHDAQITDPNGFGPADKEAYVTLASTFAKPRTWFNAACKFFLDQLRKGLEATVYRGGVVTPGDEELDIVVYSDEIMAEKITEGIFKWGIKKSVLLNSVVATPTLGSNEMAATIEGLTNGTKYFMKFVPTATSDYIGAESGIYSGVPVPAP